MGSTAEDTPSATPATAAAAAAPSQSSQPTLNSLAAEVTKLSQTITDFMKEHNIPEPSFAADSVTRYDDKAAEIFMTRMALIDKLTDMWYLTQGPSESIFNYVHSAMPDAAVLNVLNYFDFWSAVPLTGSASHATIASHVRLPEEVVSRILEHAITLRLFAPSPSPSPPTVDGKTQIQHSARSAAMAKSKGLQALVSSVLDDAGAPMLVLHEALDRYSRDKKELTQEVGETAFALLHGEGNKGFKNSWEMLEEDGEGERKGWRARNFAEFMLYLKDIFSFEDVTRDMYDWASLGEAKVVDIGGSSGHDAIFLARTFPNLTFVVQDLPKVQSVFDANLPGELKSRITFTPHSFFSPQPEQDADVFLIKMILHDWPDAEVSLILSNLIPALRPGNRVLIVEYIGNREGLEGYSEADERSKKDALPRTVRNMGSATDVRVMALFNCRERAVGEWGRLLKKADERFEVAKVKAGPHDFFAVIEAMWRG